MTAHPGIAQQVEWLAEILTAADELGYGVAEIGPRHVVLSPIAPLFVAAKDVTIRIETVVLTGATLRAILRGPATGGPIAPFHPLGTFAGETGPEHA